MPTLINIIILLALGVVFLYFGAEGVVDGSVNLAKRCGISRLAIGLTVVAFGTSCPELAVSVRAALKGSNAIAVGNVAGSNISNIALILGICCLIRPINVTKQVIRLDIPIMIGISLITSVLLLNGQLFRMVGLGLCVALGIYTAFNYIYAKKNGTEGSSIGQEPASWKSILWIIGGLALLVLGADLFVKGAIGIAKLLGISEIVIGLTIVALGTSLPELATSIVAALKKENDIILGNVIGSNVFNLLGILGVTASLIPITTIDLSIIDVAMMLLTSIALLPIARTGWTISRFEGAIFLTAWCSYIYYLYR